MSATDVTTSPPSPSAASPETRLAAASRTRALGTWTRVALACAILLGSAALRWRQSRQIEATMIAGIQGPRIDLKTIPDALGPWKGQSTELDPMIARATGADEIVTRRYVNQDTGVTVDLILLYGPAVHVYVHSPEVCYPAAGYAQVSGPDVRRIKIGPESSAPFRSLVYSKGEGATAELQEVYYCWWFNGRWAPVLGNQKQTERIPSTYKIQLARRVAPSERRDVGNPCESFLHALLPEMESRIARITKSPPS